MAKRRFYRVENCNTGEYMSIRAASLKTAHEHGCTIWPGTAIEVVPHAQYDAMQQYEAMQGTLDTALRRAYTGILNEDMSATLEQLKMAQRAIQTLAWQLETFNRDNLPEVE